MQEIIMLGISITIFIIGIIWFVFKTYKQSNFTKVLVAKSIIIMGLVLFPLYLYGNRMAVGGIFDISVSSFLGVISAITTGNSLDDTRQSVGQVSENFSVFFANYTAVLHFILMFLVLGFVVSLFKTAMMNISYRFLKQGRLYIFNEVSNRSILLAEDIKKTKKALFVFLGDDSEFYERLAKIDALVFKKNIDEVKVMKRFLKNPVYYFLLKKNEDDNLQDALALARLYNEQYKKTDEINVYVLNTTREATLIVDTIKTPKDMNFRIINEQSLSIYKLFDENPLFIGARDGSMKILVVGAGDMGMEAIKTAAWCGQTINLKPEIIVVDRDSNKEKKLEWECLELAPNTSSKLSKEECKISFHNLETQSGEFVNLLKNNPDIGYIICALGSDNISFKISLKIQEIFEAIRFEQKAPYIFTCLKDGFLLDVSQEFKNKIEAFGAMKDIYTWENIKNPYLDYLGKAVNRFYVKDYKKEEGVSIEIINEEADKNYNKHIFDRKSSRALAMHTKYKMFACLTEMQGKIIENSEWKEDISEEMISLYAKYIDNDDVLEELSKLEHRRWNMYLRSQGYTSATFKEAMRWNIENNKPWQNKLSNQNICITSWDELKNVDRFVLEKFNIVKDFQELDRIMIRGVVDIAKEAIEIKKNSN